MAIDSVALNFFVSHLVLIFVLQQRQVFLRGRPSFNLETENRISVPEGFPALFFPSRKVFFKHFSTYTDLNIWKFVTTQFVTIQISKFAIVFTR